MKFVLFRHAHKGIMPFHDPELSPQGFEQAERIYELIKKQILIKPTHLLISPKIRTAQTFSPIGENFNIKLETHTDLDQRHSNESSADFRKRIQNFLKHLENKKDTNFVVFACTHYDWIEESMTLINCDKDLNSFEFSHWSPTQHIELEWHEGLWKFIRKGTAL